MPHTIVLIQPGKPETRCYSDFETVTEAMEGVIEIFEADLRKNNPNVLSISYNLKLLFEFIDSMKDISCLVYDYEINAYAPYSKDWMKEKIYLLLRQTETKDFSSAMDTKK